MKERKSAATNVGALRTVHQTYSKKAHSRDEKRDRPNRRVSFIATGKRNTKKRKKKNIFEDVGEGKEGKVVEEILLHLGRGKGNAVLLSRD